MLIKALKILILFIVAIAVIGAGAYLTVIFMIKTEKTVVVPDLVGKDIVYSLEILTGMGLNTKVKGSEYSLEIPKNHIIFQEPEPGSEIKKGRDIRVVISKGTKMIHVPNLSGVSQRQAGIIIEENGLFQGKLSYVYDKLKKDEIISQSPDPGKMIKRGQSIDLLVSLGKRPIAYMMPDLKGESIEDAILLVEKYSLSMGSIKTVFIKNKPENRVVDQEPESGRMIFLGSIVNLVINKMPGAENKNYLHDSLGVRLFRQRLDEGFLRKQIKVNMNCFGSSIDVFDELVKPGGEVWILVPMHKDATVFFYEDGKLTNTRVFQAW